VKVSRPASFLGPGGRRPDGLGRVAVARPAAVDAVWSLRMPLFALACVALAVHPLFLQGLLPHSFDIGTYFAPSWAFLAHSLRAGSLPAWNPFVFGGAPFTGDPQAQALYPPTLVLFGLLSLPTATLGWFAFHYLLAAGGAYRLGRNLALSAPAAAISAIAFAASTFLVARAQAPSLLAGAAWAPVVLAALVGAHARSRRSFANVPLALAFALQVLSGSQQIVLPTAIACIVVAALLRSRRLVVTTLWSLGLGAMLAAPQLLPMASLVAGSTASSGIDVNGFGALGLGDRSILAGAFSQTSSETAPVYLGILGLGQALVGLVSGWRRPAAQAVAGLGIFALVWSLGIVGSAVSPVVPALATVTSHQPVRALPLAVLALALGVGMFWDHAVTARRCLAVLLVSAGSFLAAGTTGSASSEVFVESAVAGAAVLAMAWRWPRATWPLILAGLALSADLAVHNVDLRNTHQPPAVWQAAATIYPPAPPAAGVLRRLGVTTSGTRFAWMASSRVRGHQLGRALSPEGRALLLPGGDMRYRLPTVSGYNPIIDRSFTAVMRRSNGRPIRDRHNLYVTRAATKVLRAYSVGAYLCARASCPRGLPVRWRQGRLRIESDPRALPFARLAVGGRPATVERLGAVWPSPDAIDVRPLQVVTPGGRITVAERFAPGWHVSVDGVTRPLLHATFGLMSVEAARGWRRVRFSYEPPGFRAGILLALCACAICCQSLVRGVIRRVRAR